MEPFGIKSPLEITLKIDPRSLLYLVKDEGPLSIVFPLSSLYDDPAPSQKSQVCVGSILIIICPCFLLLTKIEGYGYATIYFVIISIPTELICVGISFCFDYLSSLVSSVSELSQTQLSNIAQMSFRHSYGSIISRAIF